jgi:competence protein ComEC
VNLLGSFTLWVRNPGISRLPGFLTQRVNEPSLRVAAKKALLEAFLQLCRWSDLFWEHHPALLYGLAFLLGCFAALHSHPIALLPAAIIWMPLLRQIRSPTTAAISHAFLRLLLAAVLALCGFAYSAMTITAPAEDPSHPQEWSGTAHFAIEQIRLRSKHWGQQWVYRGTISTFYSGQQLIARNIPASLLINAQAILPPTDHSYRVVGTLRKLSAYNYQLVPTKEAPFEPIGKTYNLASERANGKQALSRYIHQHIADPFSADFLTGIATGEFSNRLLQFELARFGLQHIMAISGFHFAIIASSLSCLLSSMCDLRSRTWLLIAGLTAYFLFLGCSPSILRAWLSTLIALAGSLIGRKSLGLNTLGLAMLIMLIADPLICGQLGFQFSFAATAGILLLFSPSESLLRKLWPPRPLSEAVKMNTLQQHGYCCLYFCRQAVALTIAVNIVAMPLMLFYFSTFPWMSLLYNLFFPFMVTISMLLLIAGCAVGLLLPFVGTAIHAANSYYTRFMLNYTSNIPSNVDISWQWVDFPVELVVVALCGSFIAGIYSYQQRIAQRQQSDEWAFV